MCHHTPIHHIGYCDTYIYQSNYERMRMSHKDHDVLARHL